MKKVLRKYTDFARSIDKDIKCKKGFDFGCYPIEKIIEIPKLWSEKDTKSFIDDINKTYEIENFTNHIAPEVISFLHEIGHIQSDRFSIVDALCRPILVFLANHNIPTNKLYYRLPKEEKATQWAVNYLVGNYTKILQFQKELGRTYKRYYKTMGVIA